ncbi:Prophage CP4-57 regulatory protein (AlpA) [compost metagenome]
MRAELAAAVACDEALVRKQIVAAMTGMRATHITSLVKRGAFPAPLKLSTRVVRWRAGNVKKWLAEQAATAA